MIDRLQFPWPTQVSRRLFSGGYCVFFFTCSTLMFSLCCLDFPLFCRSKYQRISVFHHNSCNTVAWQQAYCIWTSNEWDGRLHIDWKYKDRQKWQTTGWHSDIKYWSRISSIIEQRDMKSWIHISTSLSHSFVHWLYLVCWHRSIQKIMLEIMHLPVVKSLSSRAFSVVLIPNWFTRLLRSLLLTTKKIEKRFFCSVERIVFLRGGTQMRICSSLKI